MVENEITLIIGGEMNGTVGTSGQLAWVNILAAKEGNISARRSSRRDCSTNMCGEDAFVSNPPNMGLFCEFGDKPLRHYRRYC